MNESNTRTQTDKSLDEISIEDLDVASGGCAACGGGAHGALGGGAQPSPVGRPGQAGQAGQAFGAPQR